MPLPVSGFSFALAACTGDDCRSDYSFASPVTVTLEYEQSDVASLVEGTLSLYVRDGEAWADVTAGCGLPASSYGRDPVQNVLVAPVCRTGTFVIAGETNSVYLPLALK